MERHSDYIAIRSEAKVKERQIISLVQKLVEPYSSKQANDFVVKFLTGGLTNELFLVKLREGNETERRCKVLVRIYGLGTEALIDRNIEAVVFRKLEELSLGPHFYGSFVNGAVYELLEGVSFEQSQVGVEWIERDIA